MALALPALVCCGDGTTPPDPIVAVVVTPSADSLYVGDSTTFTAAALTESGATLNDRPVAWASSDATAATVSSEGVVRGTGSGTAYIRATIEGLSDSALVEVRPLPVASVGLNPPTDTIGVGWTLQLGATLRDADGGVLTGRTTAWASTSPAVTVSTSGLARGATTGTALVIASSEGVADTTFLEVLSCSGTPTSPWLSSRNRFTVPIGPGRFQRPSSPLAAAGSFRTAASFGVVNPTPVLYGGGLLYGTAAGDLVLAYDLGGSLPTDLADGPVCALPAAATLDHTFADVRPTTGLGPAGLEVRQETYASGLSADSGYVLFRYSFTNTGSSAIAGLYVGFGVDWDLEWGTGALDDVLRWNPASSVTEAAESDSLTMTPIMAMVPIVAAAPVSASGWLNGADPAHAGYFGPLSGGVTLTTVGPGDVRGVTGAGPLTLAPGARVVVYFAVVGGDNRTAFTNALAQARAVAQSLGF
jgi:hypothetical protein